MYRWLLVLLMLAVTLRGENLVKNGDFEDGAGNQPADWSRIDNLTVTWEKSGNPGRCLVFHPAVTQAAKKANAKGEPLEGDVEVKQGEDGQYSSVGAHEGVWAFALPIEIKADDEYFIIEVDVKGPRSSTLFHPQVLLRGFQRVSAREAGKHSSFFHVPHEGGVAFFEQFGSEQRPSVEGDYLMVWRKGLFCRLPTSDTWHHFRMGVKLPKTKRYRPEVILLKPYAMWPLGDYHFDNLVFRRCDKAEYERVRQEGHSAEGF